MASQNASFRIFVGGYAGVVTTLDYDTAAKSFSEVTTTDTLGTSPSWLMTDPLGKFMFSSDEVTQFNNITNAGGVFSSSIASDGSVSVISGRTTGAGPAAIDLSKDGTNILVANYNNGSMTRFTVDRATGELSPNPVQTFLFEGSGPNPSRQDHAYAHQAKYDPTGTLAFVTDLGSDLLRVFSVDANGTLATLTPVKFPPGSGPRHIAFYVEPSSKATFAYVICELGNTVSTLSIDYSTEPKATILQTVSTLTDAVNATTFGAGEIAVSPDGKFVYAGNRQSDKSAPVSDNTFAVYKRDATKGTLTLDKFYEEGGKLARYFEIHPSGKWIVLSAQNGNEVIMLERDVETGAVTKVASFNVSTPTVSIFAP